RIYILVAPLMALFFPLIEVPVNFEKPSISLEDTGLLHALTLSETEEETIATYGLPEFTVEGTKLPLLLELKDYLVIGYLSLVILLSLRLFWQIREMHQLFRKGWYQTVFRLKGNYF